MEAREIVNEREHPHFNSGALAIELFCVVITLGAWLLSPLPFRCSTPLDWFGERIDYGCEEDIFPVEKIEVLSLIHGRKLVLHLTRLNKVLAIIRMVAGKDYKEFRRCENRGLATCSGGTVD